MSGKPRQRLLGSLKKGLRIRRKAERRSRLVLPNEAVDFDRRAIFVAIPKTGTTSILAQMRKEATYLIPHPHLSITQIRDVLFVDLLRHSLGRNMTLPSDRNVVLTHAEIRQRAAVLFDSFFKFSLVRNPWARTVSLYFRREGVSVSREMDFPTFCRTLEYASDTCINPTVHPNQLDWLLDENGKLAVDYVMKLESLEDDLAELGRRTQGRLRFEGRRLNANPASKSASYRDMYDEESKERIAQLFRRDIEYFGYEF